MIRVLDTETALIRPGCCAPPLACVSHITPGTEGSLIHWTGAEPNLKAWLSNDEILVGHNIAFDMAVFCAQFPELTPAVFDKYERNQITDTMLRQKLLDIAAGCYRGEMGDDGVWREYTYGLDAVAWRLLRRKMDKDTWRLQYGTLRDLPLAEWPDGAKQYCLDDVRVPLQIYQMQDVHQEFLVNQFDMSRAGFWEYLMSCWGLRTKGEAVEHFRQMTIDQRARITERLQQAGLVRADGSRDTKQAAEKMEQVMVAAGRKMRLTNGGKPSLDNEACKDSEDPLLLDYAEYTSLAKVISNDCEMLMRGTEVPVHTRFDVAASLRSTSSNPNIQNLRRMPGIRECFVPRPGMVFIDCDYNALELWCLAQCCVDLVGFSKLGEVLNSGNDPHTALAAEYLGISYEEADKLKVANDHDFMEVRRMTKQGNFGFAGGMGEEKFSAMCKKGYGMIIPPDIAERLRAAWLNRWTEMELYFAKVDELTRNPDRIAWSQHPRTKFWRGHMTFSATANNFFQHLGAMVAKRAGWLLAKACYVDHSSPLFGSRPVAFIHDQFITETPDCSTAHEAAYEQARLMQEGARQTMPDFVPPVDPSLCRWWSKESIAEFNAQKRLIPWPVPGKIYGKDKEPKLRAGTSMCASDNYG